MEKIVIYQLLTRLFGNTCKANIKGGSLEQNGCGKFNDINDKALSEIRNMGITHVWFTGVIEHAKATSYQNEGIELYPAHLVKGNAGSPYAIVDYYDVDPDLAMDVPNRMQEFEGLIDRTHLHGLKTIIDFVPNHLARCYKSDKLPKGLEDFGRHDDVSMAFAPNNNYYYLPNTVFNAPVPDNGQAYSEIPAKVTGNDCLTPNPSINDWYETIKLNYGIDIFNGNIPHFNPVPDTWQKMLNILLFWAEKGVDGFRCDMAEMVPVAFWNYAISHVKELFPKVCFIAEVYNPWLYNDYIFNGKFDILYDKVGMYDTLKEVVRGEKSAWEVSNSWERVSPIHKHMLFFVENHDEQRLASPFFAGNAFKGWPAFFVSATINANAVMLYFGQEVGVNGMDEEGFSGLDGRTTIFDYWGVQQFQNWTCGNTYSGIDLTSDQKILRNRYTLLLNLLNSDEAFTIGGVYDLLYANDDQPYYNAAQMVSYLRFTENSVLLCIANFSDQIHQARLIIPIHAFNFCNLNPEGYFKSTDMLNSEAVIQFPAQVASTKGVGFKIEPYQTLVFKLK